MTKKTRQSYEKAGRRAETLSCWYLRLKGYLILERRYKTRQGEIDIIAKKRNSIIITEVKQRAHAHNLHETVSFKNSQRIINAAEIFMSRHPRYQATNFELRFDIVHVIGRWKIIHIKDAFRSY